MPEKRIHVPRVGLRISGMTDSGGYVEDGRVEAIGTDWIVVRDEYGHPHYRDWENAAEMESDLSRMAYSCIERDRTELLPVPGPFQIEAERARGSNG